VARRALAGRAQLESEHVGAEVVGAKLPPKIRSTRALARTTEGRHSVRQATRKEIRLPMRATRVDGGSRWCTRAAWHLGPPAAITTRSRPPRDALRSARSP
jgi:hypothetical protein